MSDKITLTGNTRAIKDALKSKGWKWDGRVWSLTLCDAHIARIADDEQRPAALVAFDLKKKACKTYWRGICIYTSPAWQDTPMPAIAMQGDTIPSGWCVDDEDGRLKPRHLCDMPRG